MDKGENLAGPTARASDGLIGSAVKSLAKRETEGRYRIFNRLCRELLPMHPSPAYTWLDQLWDYALDMFYTDPEPVVRLNQLVRGAKADSVREWYTDKLVRLSESAGLHQEKVWALRELLEMVMSGGAIHVQRHIRRLTTIAVKDNMTVYASQWSEIMARLSYLDPNRLT